MNPRMSLPHNIAAHENGKGPSSQPSVAHVIVVRLARMPVGQCKLCKRTKRLVLSHFIARALYGKLREPGKPDPNPIVITVERSISSSRHITGHVLCRKCDQKIARLGEDWVSANCFDGERFPLLERLKLALPTSSRYTLKTAVTYSGRDVGIDTERLGYFALSLLWRAAVHTWTTSSRETYSVALSTPIEPLRAYLYGTATFPADMYVLATVCLDGMSSRLIVPPYGANAEDCNAYNLFVSGIFLRIMFGKVPEYIRERCCVTSTLKLIHARDCSDLTTEIFRAMRTTSKPSASLMRRFESIT